MVTLYLFVETIIKELTYKTKSIMKSSKQHPPSFSEKVMTPKGWVQIWGIYPNGEKKLLVDQKNGLVVNAKKMIAYALGNQPGYFIDTIKVYKGGSLLATSPLVTYTFPADDQLQVDARFDETSFNDTLDELRLTSVGGGDFSHVTGLSVLKDSTLQLQISWLLTINDL